MRGFVPDFELRTPASLPELLKTISTPKDPWYIFAGGTDLMVLYESGILKNKKFLNILNIPELKQIKVEKDFIRLGACVTFAEVQHHPQIKKEFPNLVEAARLVGSVAIQNRATVGGNIANASPAGDSLPALLAYDAELELASEGGTRVVPYLGFHTGYKSTVMQSHEIIAHIRLPRRSSSWQHYYRKVGTRKAQAISKVVCAAVARLQDKTLDDVRLAYGSVGPQPLRCVETERMLRGQPLTKETLRLARESLLREIKPIDDIRSTQEFRLEVAGNILESFLYQLIQQTP